MPFPNAERVIYKKNPLKTVICQLRYPPILSIDKEAPAEFQEAVRSEFPDYVEKYEFPLELALGKTSQYSADTSKTPDQGSTIKNYEFSTFDKNWRINLTRIFLSLSTTKYSRWEDFREKLKLPFESLLKHHRPAFFTRIGIRYIDVFERSTLGLQECEWKDLIDPHFLGLLASDINSSIKSIQNVAEIKLADDKGMSKITTALVINVQTKEPCIMIDSDLFYSEHIKIEDSNEILEFLHSKACNLIHFIVKDKLHKAMEPEKL